MTLSQRQAKLLAASLWLIDLDDAEQTAWLDAMAEMLTGAANGHGAFAPLHQPDRRAR